MFAYMYNFHIMYFYKKNIRNIMVYKSGYYNRIFYIDMK